MAAVPRPGSGSTVAAIRWPTAERTLPLRLARVVARAGGAVIPVDAQLAFKLGDDGAEVVQPLGQGDAVDLVGYAVAVLVVPRCQLLGHLCTVVDG